MESPAFYGVGIKLRRMIIIELQLYSNEYLRNHPRIRKDMTLMVCQLAQDNTLRRFTNTGGWKEHLGWIYRSLIFAIVEELVWRSPVANRTISFHAFKQ